MHSGKIAGNNGLWFHVPDDDCSQQNTGSVMDSDPVRNRGLRPHPNIIAYINATG